MKCNAWLFGLLLWGCAQSSVGTNALPAANDRARPGSLCPAEPVRIAFADRSGGPFLVGNGDHFAEPEPGLAVMEVRRVMASMGCAGTLLRLPQLRLLRDLTEGNIDLAVGLGDTPQRLRDWHFPTLSGGEADSRRALMSSPVHWIVLARNKPKLQDDWMEGRLSGRMGAVRGSVSELFARRAGVDVQPVVDTAKLAVLLALDRFDAIAAPLTTYADEIEAPMAGRDALERLEPALGYLHYYAPASRAFRQRHPQFVEAFWLAMCNEARRRPLAPGCKGAEAR